MATSILTLKVFLEPSGVTKTFRFSGEEAVDSIIKEINAKTGEGGKDFGLFIPPHTTFKLPGVWMERNRALRFYNIKNDARIEYKKKHRPWTIRTADDAERKVLVNDAGTVREISDTVGEKLGLGKFTEEFCLAVGGTAKTPNFLDESKTLHDQFVQAGTTLEFLKRYVVRDREVNEKDAYILHLLYLGTQKQILAEVYVLTRNDIRDFAALQLQVTYGDHNPEKHKPGFADMSTFIPAGFIQHTEKDEIKRLVAEVYRDHKKLKGLRDFEAKKRYIQLARSLKTYGYSFFDVQLQKEEKVEKKSKKLFKDKHASVPKLKNVALGISYEKIVLLDNDTNQFIDTHPFSSMKSWNGVSSVLELQFAGDIVYHFVCPNVDVIVQTIAGYINILMKLRKDQEQYVSHSSGEIGEVDDGAGSEWGPETTKSYAGQVNPSPNFSAAQGTHMAGGFGGPTGGASTLTADSIMGNVNSMPSALRAAKLLSNDLVTGRGNWGKKGALTEENWLNQLETTRNNIQNDLNGFLDILANHEAGTKLDRPLLDRQSASIGINLTSIATAARNLSALNEEKNAHLLDGAKALCDSLADLMSLVIQADSEQGLTGPTLNDIIIATKKQFAAAQILFAGAPTAYVDEGTKVLLMGCIADVDMKLKRLVQIVREDKVAWTPENKLIIDAETAKVETIKDIALSTMSSLVPHMGDPQAVKHIHFAKTTIQELLQGLEVRYQTAISGQPGAAPCEAFKPAVDSVKTALANLFEASKAKEARGVTGHVDVISPSVDLLNFLAAYRAAVRAGDPYSLNYATTAIEPKAEHLINVVKVLAPQLPHFQVALEASVAQLEDDTKSLIFESKQLQVNMANTEISTRAIALVGVIERTVQSLISDVGQFTAINNLRYHSKNVASHVIRLGSASLITAAQVSDTEKLLLYGVGKELGEGLTQMLNLLQLASANPDNIIAQHSLQDGVLKLLPLITTNVQSVTSVLPKLSNPTLQQSLATTVNMAYGALNELVGSCQRIDSMHGNVLIAQALGSLDLIQADIETANFFAEQGTLEMAHNITLAQALEKIAPAIVRFKTEADHMIDAAKNGGREVWPDHVLSSNQAFEKVADLAILIARALPSDRLAQTRVLGSSQKAINDLRDLIAASRVLCFEPSSGIKLAVVQKCNASLAEHLDAIVATAVGFNPESIEKALKEIVRAKEALEAPLAIEEAQKREQHDQAANQLRSAAKAVIVPIHTFQSTSKTSPNQIGYDAKLTTAAVIQLVELTHVLAETSPSGRDQILQASKLLLEGTEALVKSSHEVAAQSEGALVKVDKLSAQVLQSVHELCATITTAPTTDADEAINRIMASLAHPPLTHQSVVVVRPELVLQLQSQLPQLSKLVDKVSGLSKAEVPVLPDYQAFCAEVATTLENISSVAAACELCDGTKPLMSLSAFQIHQGLDLVLENIHSVETVQQILPIIATLAGTFYAHDIQPKINTTVQKRERDLLLDSVQQFQSQLGKCLEAIKNPALLQQPHQENYKGDIQKLKDNLAGLSGVIFHPQRNPEYKFDPTLAKQISSVTKSLGLPATTMLRATSLLTPVSEAEDPHREELAGSVATIQKALKELEALCASLERGKEEMGKASKVVQKAVAEFDSAILFASIGALEVTGADKARLQEYQGHAIDSVKGLSVDVKNLVGAIKANDPAELLAVALSLQKNIPNLAHQLTLVASSLDEPTKAVGVLTTAKMLGQALEGTINMGLKVDKAVPQSINLFAMNAAKTTQELSKLMALLNTSATAQANLDKAIQTVVASMNDLENPLQKGSFQECQEALTLQAREIGTNIAALLNARTEAQILASANQLTTSVTALNESVRGAVTATEDSVVKAQFLEATKGISQGVVDAITRVKGIMVGSGEKPQLLTAFNTTNKAIAALLHAAQSDKSGEGAFEDASDQILNALNGLTLLKMLPFEGAAPEGPSFGTLAEQITATIAKINQTALSLASSDSMDPNDLLLAARDLADALNALRNLCTAIQPKFQNPKEATKLLNSAIDTTINASRILLLAKAVAKDPLVKPQLVSAQKVISKTEGKVERTLKKAVKEQKGINQDFEKHLEALKKVSANHPAPTEGATLVDLKRIAKDLMTTVSDLMMSSSDGEAILFSATIPSLYQELLAVSLAVPETAKVPEHKDAFLTAALEVAEMLKTFMTTNMQLPTRNESSFVNNELALSESQLQVTKAIGGLVECSKLLPVEKKVEMGLDEVVIDSSDIEAFAENELLKCAQMIKDAASMIVSMGPRKKTNLSVGLDTEDINEAILEAARAIAAATGHLIECAAVSQAERKEESKSGSSKYNADPAWANGLISAAQSVAGNVKNLVEAANQSASGKSDEERLVATARAVAATTIHLVTASRTKADANAPSQRNLSKASNSVTFATQQLVIAANAVGALVEEEEEDFSRVNFAAASGIRAQMEQRSKIERLEKELRDKRQELLTIRRARYQKDK